MRSVGIYRGGFLNVGDRRAWVIAPPRSSPQLIPSGQLSAGNVTARHSRASAITGGRSSPKRSPHELHLHIGESFTLPAPHPTTFRLAGLSTNAGWPPGAS